MLKQLFRSTELSVLLALGFGVGVLLFNPQPASAAQTEVKIIDGPVLDPPDIGIKEGDTVVWKPMVEGIPHHLIANPKFPKDVFPETGVFNSASPPSDRTKTFDKSGLIHYICKIHPRQMIGTITVTK